MKLKKVINLFGGPGTGKSTAAAGIFHWLKVNGYNAEYVSEYAKELTYEDRHIVLQQDQLYIFAKQHRKIFRLRDTVEYVICDSPLLLPAIYHDVWGSKNSIYNGLMFFDFVLHTFEQYPNMNFVLTRPDRIEYNPDEGRTQTEFESLKIDKKIRGILDMKYAYRELITGEYDIEEICMEITGESP